MVSQKQTETIFYLSTTRYTPDAVSETWALVINGKKPARPRLLARGPKYYYPNTICFHNGELYESGVIGGEPENNPIFKIGNFKPIVTRKSEVSTLFSHNGILYDGTVDGKIYQTLEDLKGEKPVAVRKTKRHYDCGDHIITLFGNGEKLYDVVQVYPNWEEYLLFNTLEDRLGEEPLARREEPIRSLTIHQRELYDATGRYVFLTLKDLEGKDYLAESKENIETLCSYEGKLFDASGNKVFDTLNDLLRKNPVVERAFPIIALLSKNGRLYDISHLEKDFHCITEIHDTLDNRLVGIIPSGEERIKALTHN